MQALFPSFTDLSTAAERSERPPGLAHNRAQRPYTGINIFSLWASATGEGFAAPIWIDLGIRRIFTRVVDRLGAQFLLVHNVVGR